MIYIDGRIVPKEEAFVSVYDHGLLYGDGIFEGIRIYSGTVFRLKEHIDRLYEGARVVMLQIPLSPEEMEKAVLDTVAASGKENGYIRLVVTRGKGDLGISPATCPKPSVIIIVDDIQLYPKEYYEKGIRVITAAIRRNTVDSLDPRVKSLNYLNNILAKMQAQQAGCLEAVMLDRHGYVTECTGDNIFIVKQGCLITPPVTRGALDGITRRTVIELAETGGIPVREGDIALFDLYTADECFLTGTGAEMIPVTEIDGRTVGDGRPGSVTFRLREMFRKEIA
ncbi:MAG TPA: branched-chain-amino-acid transaminase [Spirochaetota bacterium]|nr:branched-chain-amino-acid transaminase [Spirochaetota bacterium]HPQ55420.1 branched-chain-amino-acid transaminase [Spirochaetota bacterium]